jgi:hypothetical protein
VIIEGLLCTIISTSCEFVIISKLKVFYKLVLFRKMK